MCASAPISWCANWCSTIRAPSCRLSSPSAPRASTTGEERWRSLVGYIVCRNHEEAKKDAADRATILAALERQLKKGDKALVGNGGYRRFLATTGENGFVIDRAKAEDAGFDGVFVLRTNTDLGPLEAMFCCKQLTMAGWGL